MPSRATIAARPKPVATGVQTYARSAPMPSTPGAGSIVSSPTTQRSMAGMAGGQGYGANHNNMPVGVVNGNNVYSFGDQGSYGPGKEGNILADPSKTTYFSGRTASAGASGAGGTSKTANAGLGAGGLGGLGGLGAYGAGGAGSAIGAGLQKDLDAANAANDARYNQALGINQQGGQDQLNALNSGYGDVYGTIAANEAKQIGLTSGLGGTQHEQENRRLAQQLGSSQQSLTGRGLGNSTIVDSMAKGYQTDSAFNQRAIDEENARLQLGIYQNSGNQMVNAKTGYVGSQVGTMANNQNQRVGIIGSRTDQGPNIGQYLNLLSQAGSQNGAAAAGTGAYGASGGGGGGFSLNRPGGSTGGGGGGGQSQSVNDASYGINQPNARAGITSPLNIPYQGASSGITNSPVPGSENQGDSSSYSGDYGTYDLGAAGDSGASGAAGQASADDVRQAAAKMGIDLSHYPDHMVIAMASMYGL